MYQCLDTLLTMKISFTYLYGRCLVYFLKFLYKFYILAKGTTNKVAMPIARTKSYFSFSCFSVSINLQ